MSIAGWKTRLAEAFAKSGRSMRDVSLAANAGPGYMFSILNDGKDPSLEYLSRICDALDVSLAYVLHGFDISPETERLIALAEANPVARQAIITLLTLKSPG